MLPGPAAPELAWLPVSLVGLCALPLLLAVSVELPKPNSSPPNPEVAVALLPPAMPHVKVCMRGGRRVPPPAAASERVSAGMKGLLMVRCILGAGGGFGMRELAVLPAVEAAQDCGPDPWVLPVVLLPSRWGVPDPRVMSTDARGLLPPLLRVMSGSTTEPLGMSCMSCRRLLARRVSGSAMLGDSMA